MSEDPTSERDRQRASELDCELIFARLGYVTEALHVWVWETDAEHRFSYLSPSVGRFTGRQPEWHFGRTREQLGNVVVDEGDWKQFRLQLDRRRRFGPLEFRRVEGNRTVWIRTAGDPIFGADGTFIGYRGVGCEISDEMAAREGRARAETELSEKFEMLSATIAAFPCAVSVFDREYRLAFANSKYYAILDLPVGQFPSGTPMQLIVAFLAERGEFVGGEPRDLIDRHIALLESGAPHTFQRTRPNGRRLEITGVPLGGGGLVRTYADVSERIELLWRLEARNRELAAALDALAAAKAETAELSVKLADRDAP